MASTDPHRGGIPGLAISVAILVLTIVVALVVVAIVTSRAVLVASLGLLLGVLVVGCAAAALIARNAVAHDEARTGAGAALVEDSVPEEEELSPHDLPLDDPGRPDAELRASEHRPTGGANG